MTVLLLIRHGRTTANASGVLAGWTEGVLLDERGRADAQELGVRLAGLPLAAVVTSPLERTRETSALIRGDELWPERVDDRIAEARYGDWTGRSLAELAGEPLWKVVQEHPSAAVFPQGESMAAMAARAVAAVRFWNEELGPDAMYAMVSHGDVIKAILADALGMHLDLFQRISVAPASVSVIRYSPTRPFVERMNDTGGTFSGLIPKPKDGSGAPGSDAAASSDAAVGGGDSQGG